jgi:hypothetical protein
MMVHLRSDNAEVLVNSDFIVTLKRIKGAGGEYTNMEMYNGQNVAITEEPGALVMGRPKTP